MESLLRSMMEPPGAADKAAAINGEPTDEGEEETAEIDTERGQQTTMIQRMAGPAQMIAADGTFFDSAVEEVITNSQMIAPDLPYAVISLLGLGSHSQGASSLLDGLFGFKYNDDDDPRTRNQNVKGVRLLRCAGPPLLVLDIEVSDAKEVNLASIMEKADEALLPAGYKEVGAVLHSSPLGLGSLTLFRSFVQALCYPLAAYMAVRHNRTHVIALGAFRWAVATFLVVVSDTFAQVAIARALNDVGLALVTPSIQSLVADSMDDATGGTAFGWLQLTSNLGSLLGGFFALVLASTSVMGVQGWRLAFHLVAAVSALVGDDTDAPDDPSFRERQ